VNIENSNADKPRYIWIQLFQMTAMHNATNIDLFQLPVSGWRFHKRNTANANKEKFHVPENKMVKNLLHLHMSANCSSRISCTNNRDWFPFPVSPRILHKCNTANDNGKNSTVTGFSHWHWLCSMCGAPLVRHIPGTHQAFPVWVRHPGLATCLNKPPLQR